MLACRRLILSKTPFQEETGISMVTLSMFLWWHFQSREPSKQVLIMTLLKIYCKGDLNGLGYESWNQGAPCNCSNAYKWVTSNSLITQFQLSNANQRSNCVLNSVKLHCHDICGCGARHHFWPNKLLSLKMKFNNTATWPNSKKVELDDYYSLLGEVTSQPQSSNKELDYKPIMTLYAACNMCWFTDW